MDPVTEAIVQETSFLQKFSIFMDEGGIFMWIILAMWLLALAISLERFKSLLFFDVDGNKLMSNIKAYILKNEVNEAIKICSNSKALLPNVMKNGLKRANQTREHIQDALEATILESIPKAEKRLGYLSMIANISTLMGLLGTIYGLIESFAAVASADPAEKAKLLALGISKAMNTTAFGLICAISVTVIHSFLNNKSEKIITEMEENSVKLIDVLGAKKSVQVATNTAA